MNIQSEEGGGSARHEKNNRRSTGKWGSANGNTEISASQILDTISRRRVPLLLCISLGILCAVLAGLVTPRRYEAVGKVTVDYGQTEMPGMGVLAQAAGVVDPTALQTQVSILQTDSIAWSAVRSLRLDQNPDALPRLLGIGPVRCQSPRNSSVNDIGPECRQILLDEFHKRLHVQSIPRTSIIEIRYRSRSRYLAAEVVNALASEFVERNFDMKYESATKGSAWLAGQLEGVRKDAASAVHNLVEYQRERGAVSIEGGPNLLLSQLTVLSQQVLEAQGDRMVREARYRTALTGDPEAMLSVTQGTTLQVLHTEDQTLRSQLAELSAQFDDSYPKVVQVKAQLASVQTEMRSEMANTVSRLKDEYEASVKSEQLMRSELERQKQSVFNAAEASEQLDLLNRDVEATGDLYKQVIQRLKAGGILAAGNGPDAMILEPASIPFLKAEPHMALNLLVGIVIGALAGLGLCGLVEGLDGRIAAQKEVNELCPIAGVGVIPCLSGGGKQNKSTDVAAGRVDALEDPAGDVAEASRLLRTSLFYSRRPQPKVILISSAYAGEGVCCVTANLGAVLATASRRVLLIDGDLRDKSLSRLFRRAEAAGLTQAVESDDPNQFFSAVQDAARGQEAGNAANLIVLPAGSGGGAKPDLMDSERMRALIARWRTEFDHVVISAPRLLETSGPSTLATMADAVVLTVRAGLGRGKELTRSIEVLEEIEIRPHGAVVTDFRNRSRFLGWLAGRSIRFAGTEREPHHA